MNFSDKYLTKMTVDQMMHPQDVQFPKFDNMIDTFRVYGCDVCQSPTSWRLVENNTETPICSEECLDIHLTLNIEEV